MILDAHSLTTLQSCPRRFLLEADYEVLKWRPKSLLDACLRKGIAAVSNGVAPGEAAKQLKADYLQAAANPGLDLPRGSNPYVIAKDMCAMLDTILRAAAHWSLPALADAPTVRLNSNIEWKPLAFSAADGLHRIVTVDHWGDMDLSRELHGWYVFGDVCATRLPLTIHAIQIGQTRNGRRASAWARGWHHPTWPLKMRFAHKDGSGFKGWLPTYLADSRDADPDEWVEKMEQEGVAQKLARTIPVDVPSEAVRADTIGQILQEAARAGEMLAERRSSTWRAIPMSRGACDVMRVACPFQECCHQTVTNVMELGLYKSKSEYIVAAVA